MREFSLGDGIGQLGAGQHHRLIHCRGVDLVHADAGGARHGDEVSQRGHRRAVQVVVALELKPHAQAAVLVAAGNVRRGAASAQARKEVHAPDVHVLPVAQRDHLVLGGALDERVRRDRGNPRGSGAHEVIYRVRAQAGVHAAREQHQTARSVLGHTREGHALLLGGLGGGAGRSRGGVALAHGQGQHVVRVRAVGMHIHPGVLRRSAGQTEAVGAAAGAVGGASSGQGGGLGSRGLLQADDLAIHTRSEDRIAVGAGGQSEHICGVLAERIHQDSRGAVPDLHLTPAVAGDHGRVRQHQQRPDESAHRAAQHVTEHAEQHAAGVLLHAAHRAVAAAPEECLFGGVVCQAEDARPGGGHGSVVLQHARVALAATAAWRVLQ
eukprot:Colp12_sorted_trinity150504_noHs@3667